MKKMLKCLIVLSLIVMFTFLPDFRKNVMATMDEEFSTYAIVSDLSAPNYVSEGLFFIKSRASTASSTCFLTDFDYFSVTGGAFSDTEAQQWHIVDAGNGYYYIISAQSGKYLTAPNLAEEGMLELSQYLSGNSDRQRWKFVVTSNVQSVVSYRIVPKAHESNMCLGISDTLGFYGHEGLQKEYNNYETDYFSEWYLVTYETEASIYYDKALNAKFSASNMNAQTTLLELMNSVKDVFVKTLGIRFDFSTPTMIESTPDSCKIINSQSLTSNFICPANPYIMGTCEHYNSNSADGGFCENCTSCDQIYRDFISAYPGTVKNVSILFTGNTLFDEFGYEASRSYTWYDYGISIQTTSAPSVYYSETLATLVHEMAHHIGAPDHYHEWIEVDGQIVCRGGDMCITCNATTGRSDWCIMRTTNFTPTSFEIANYDEIFCRGCLNDMEFYLDRYILN